ncbi:Response regulator receiver domain-containing protein [Noviherbaspirillum humi]|uniref:Response regulator receiver domain-containing protein n=1 Tax=Noviherbaspirillum humi TaxID=1688639 RepID=A0A239DR18_9BURK|nr:response regulator transcription factor [Noviherbaspirillum humi]SNS35085.1 Response regulator receiver domain-containing protein [Noviherbaspirillum humi]
MNPAASPYVLIVEDDTQIGRLLSLLMTRQGYRIELETDGLAALERIGKAEAVPALVLLDLMLPRRDGYEIASFLRTCPGWQQVPVIMLSARNGQHDAARREQAGIDEFIAKPFQPAELLQRLQPYMKAAGSA